MRRFGLGLFLIMLTFVVLPAYGQGLRQFTPDFLVNDDMGSAEQEFCDVAMNSAGNIVIIWNDWRNGPPDIYAQRYSPSGTAIGPNFKVNDDTGTAYQDNPSVAMDGSGNFVITWSDWRYGSYPIYADIYAQRFDSSGTALGPNFQVNDDTGNITHYYPAVAMDVAGNFIICWEDNRSYLDIYAQRYNSSGAAIGSNSKVNDNNLALCLNPSIAIDGTGRFVVSWIDHRNGNPDIYAQRFNSSGTAIGSNFKVCDDTGNAWPAYPAVAMDSVGKFVITWEDYRNSYYPYDNGDIYAQRYNSSGVTLGSNFRVNSDTGTAFQYNPAIAMDKAGRTVIAWEDWRYATGPNYYRWTYAQRYNSSGSLLDTNYWVHDPLYASLNEEPAVAANDSTICLVWKDSRRAMGWDIYAKIVDWDWPGCSAVPGNVNGAGGITLADIVHLLNYVFDRDNPPCLGTDPGNCWTPNPLCRGDVNNSMDITLGDIIHLLNYVFDRDNPPCFGPDPGNCWAPVANGACCLPLP
jgi:hypothetical protein